MASFDLIFASHRIRSPPFLILFVLRRQPRHLEFQYICASPSPEPSYVPTVHPTSNQHRGSPLPFSAGCRSFYKFLFHLLPVYFTPFYFRACLLSSCYSFCSPAMKPCTTAHAHVLMTDTFRFFLSPPFRRSFCIMVGLSLPMTTNFYDA